MRAALGLSAPERRIGQTAHDFVAALGALRRSSAAPGSGTARRPSPSRFLQRIAAVAGEAAIGRARAAGEVYLTLAREIDRPAAFASARPPEPKPPVALRPRQLSVTHIETLRRDPYAIYAERILKLAPLEPIGQTLGPREIGEVWHDALCAFAEKFPAGPLPNDARDWLVALTRERFQPMLADPSFRALAWPRVEHGLEFFLDFERARRHSTARILVEKSGELMIPLRGGASFKLTARADRIDIGADGGAVLVDYKTGAPPGVKEVEVGLAPQLTLEAAMLARGAFADAPDVRPVGALYLKLGGAKGGEVRDLTFKDASFGEVVERHFAELVKLLEQFASADTPYLSRPHPKFAGREGDYDHLARVKEWSATGGKSDGPAGAAE